MPLKRLQLFISDAHLTRLRALRELTGLSVAEHIRRAVEAYLNSLNA